MNRFAANNPDDWEEKIEAMTDVADAGERRTSSRALVIPVDGPVYEMTLASRDGSDLSELQAAVGGSIEAVPLPQFLDPDDEATSYVNEEGKFDPDCKANMRATDLLVPGVGLRWGDYVAGALVVIGFDPETGEHRDLPERVERAIRKIEREAS